MLTLPYKVLGERLDRKQLRRSIADYLCGKTRTITIGRSSNTAGFTSSTPIDLIDGDSPPELVGHPYLSTTYRRGSFTKNLYTPSTLRVVVGRDWRSND